MKFGCILVQMLSAISPMQIGQFRPRGCSSTGDCCLKVAKQAPCRWQSALLSKVLNAIKAMICSNALTSLRDSLHAACPRRQHRGIGEGLESSSSDSEQWRLREERRERFKAYVLYCAVCALLYVQVSMNVQYILPECKCIRLYMNTEHCTVQQHLRLWEGIVCK